jgi:hypothetical protein
VSPRLLQAGLVGGSLAMAMGLAGCGSSDHGTSLESTGANGSAGQSAPTLVGAKPAVGDLQIQACPVTQGEIAAKGVVHNTSKSPHDYVVKVSWLDSAGTTIQTGYATAKAVAPKASVDWSIKATLVKAAASCTTNLAEGKLPSS